MAAAAAMATAISILIESIEFAANMTAVAAAVVISVANEDRDTEDRQTESQRAQRVFSELWGSGVGARDSALGGSSSLEMT